MRYPDYGRLQQRRSQTRARSYPLIWDKGGGLEVKAVSRTASAVGEATSRKAGCPILTSRSSTLGWDSTDVGAVGGLTGHRAIKVPWIRQLWNPTLSHRTRKNGAPGNPLIAKNAMNGHPPKHLLHDHDLPLLLRAAAPVAYFYLRSIVA